MYKIKCPKDLRGCIIFCSHLVMSHAGMSDAKIAKAIRNPLSRN
jgi:hypothetical protein